MIKTRKYNKVNKQFRKVNKQFRKVNKQFRKSNKRNYTKKRKFRGGAPSHRVRYFVDNEPKYASLNEVIERAVEDIRFNNIKDLKRIYLPNSRNTILLKLLKRSTNPKLSIENIDEEYNKVAVVRTNLDIWEKRLSDLRSTLNSADMVKYENYMLNKTREASALTHAELHRAGLWPFVNNWIYRREQLAWAREVINYLSEHIGKARMIADQIEENLLKTKQEILNRSTEPNLSSSRKISSIVSKRASHLTRKVRDSLRSRQSSRQAERWRGERRGVVPFGLPVMRPRKAVANVPVGLVLDDTNPHAANWTSRLRSSLSRHPKATEAVEVAATPLPIPSAPLPIPSAPLTAYTFANFDQWKHYSPSTLPPLPHQAEATAATKRATAQAEPYQTPLAQATQHRRQRAAPPLRTSGFASPDEWEKARSAMSAEAVEVAAPTQRDLLLRAHRSRQPTLSSVPLSLPSVPLSLPSVPLSLPSVPQGTPRFSKTASRIQYSEASA